MSKDGNNTALHQKSRAMLLDAIEGNTYESVANRFGLNRYYIWTMINDPDYNPPAWVYNRLGYKTTRTRYRPRIHPTADEWAQIKTLSPEEKLARLLKEGTGG